MIKSLHTLLLLASVFFAFPQQQKMYYDDALSLHLKSYNKQSTIAIEHDNLERADFLFDSLVNHHLKNTYIPHIVLNKVKGGKMDTNKLKRSFLLITKASWDLQDDDEIEAINALSKMYKGQVDIIVLFWSSRIKAKELSKKYSSNIILTYVDETQNKSNQIVSIFKHSFGAPACYFVSDDKQLVTINRRFAMTFNKPEVNELVFSTTNNQIHKMLFNDSTSPENISTAIIR